MNSWYNLEGGWVSSFSQKCGSRENSRLLLPGTVSSCGTIFFLYKCKEMYKRKSCLLWCFEKQKVERVPSSSLCITFHFNKSVW